MSKIKKLNYGYRIGAPHPDGGLVFEEYETYEEAEQRLETFGDSSDRIELAILAELKRRLRGASKRSGMRGYVSMALSVARANPELLPALTRTNYATEAGEIADIVTRLIDRWRHRDIC